MGTPISLHRSRDPSRGPRLPRKPRGALDAYAVATLTRVSGEMPAAAPPAQEEGYLSTTAEAAKTAIDRLAFFSDAVVAIAMTLLALVFTFLVSIPVAFVLYAWAFAIWSLIPLWIALARIAQHRLSARTGSGT